MKIVKAQFEDEDQAEFEYEDLVRQKSFLSNYANQVDDSIVVRCSSEEKAQEVREILEEVTTSEDIAVSEGESGGLAEKVKSTFRGVSEGVREVQGPLRSAGEKISRVRKEPKGGYIQKIFGGEEEESEIYGVVGASFDTEKNIDITCGVLSRKGVPNSAVEIEDNQIFVKVSSEEKFDEVSRWLQDEGGSTWRVK